MIHIVTNIMNEFKQWYNEQEFSDQEWNKEPSKQAWNSVLDKLKDNLVSQIEVFYNFQENGDIHYVKWNKIESLIDELKVND